MTTRESTHTGQALRACFGVFLLVGCSENALHAHTKSTASTTDSASDTEAPAPGDSGADSGDPADGHLPPCDAVALAETASVPVDEACVGTLDVVTDPWEMAVEWQWSARPSAPGTAMEATVTPAIDDLDGDGVPDIVVVASTDVMAETRQGVLVVLDGRTGTPWLEVEGFYAHTAPSIGDVDGDGVLDIVALGSNMRVRAIAIDGTQLWESDDTTGMLYQHTHIIDLDQDGTAEVVGGLLVLDGTTGDTIAKLPNDTGSWIISTTAVADLDQDGQHEVVHQGAVYDATGTRLWDMGLTDGRTFAPVVVQADTSPELELAVVTASVYSLFASDGTLLASQQLHHEWGVMGPPCVADFDGDGAAEVGIPAGQALYLAELDGHVYATATVNDFSSNAGCSGFDFDGDGAVEVVFADEQTVHILDGRTGAALVQQGGHASITIIEYPAIADVDADGSAELVVASNSGPAGRWEGITVLGHPEGSWQDAGPSWRQFGRHAEPTNTYNAKVAQEPALSDVSVALTDWCLPGCSPDDALLLSVQVTNSGGRDATDVTVTVLADNEGVLTPISDRTLDVPAATALAGFELRVPLGAVGSDGVVVSVDPPDAELECDETNNRVRWSNVCE